MIDRRGIVYGPSAPEKRELARRLRREMTPAEEALWQAVRGGKVGGLRFRRQQVIDGFIVDFYCHAAGLVLECDGGVHQGQRAYDAERDALLARRGLRVLRFANEAVLKELPVVLRQIEAAAEAQRREKRSDLLAASLRASGSHRRSMSRDRG